LTAPAAGATAAPPVEVITAPAPPATPENGVSAIRDVTLEPGVPDLTRGRRPVVPPLARMAGTSGSVEVSFSVSAAGTTSILAATGPDLLRPAAEQAVASWVFRRARADRAYLVAVFTSEGDKGTAVVRPQTPPAAAPSAAPAPTKPPATPDTPKAPPAPQP
jgi:outer membrane biosynthesis protein TonB